RVLQLKVENKHFKLDPTRARSTVQFALFVFDFEVQDSSDFKISPSWIPAAYSSSRSKERRSSGGSGCSFSQKVLGEFRHGQRLTRSVRLHEMRSDQNQQFGIGLLCTSTAEDVTKNGHVADPWNLADHLGNAIINEPRDGKAFTFVKVD